MGLLGPLCDDGRYRGILGPLCDDGRYRGILGPLCDGRYRGILGLICDGRYRGILGPLCDDGRYRGCTSACQYATLKQWTLDHNKSLLSHSTRTSWCTIDTPDSML